LVAALALMRVFIVTSAQLKMEQNSLEMRLWKERAAIREKYEDKVKSAQVRSVCHIFVALVCLILYGRKSKNDRRRTIRA
jgi:hypothetical protein